MTEILDLENFLPYRLSRTAALLSDRFHDIYKTRYGLTVPEWRVLATLGQFGEASATMVGKHSPMHKTKVSRAVLSVEERQWLARRRSDIDRREETLRLTSAGRRVYRDIVPRAASFQDELLRRIGPDATQIFDVLTRLESALRVPKSAS